MVRHAFERYLINKDARENKRDRFARKSREAKKPTILFFFTLGYSFACYHISKYKYLFPPSDC